MAASITDLITAVMNGGAPVPTTVSSIRTPGATTLAVGALTHWPTISAVHFVTGTPTTDAEGNAIINPTSLALWKAIVSGTTLVNLTLEASATGSDPGNAVNDIVQMAPDSAWAQDLFTALTAEHNTLGNHTQAMTINGDNIWNMLTQEWLPSNESWAYASATTITVPSNATLKYQVGDLIQLTQSATVKYFVVTAVATTLLTVAPLLGTTLANSAISANSYAHSTPYGAPSGVAFVPYKFQAYMSTTGSTVVNTWTRVATNVKNWDTGNNLDIATNVGRFTATVAGTYRFDGHFQTAVYGATGRLIVSLYKNGAEYAFGSDLTTSSGYLGAFVGDEVQLAAGDYVEFMYYSSISQAWDASFNRIRFSGYLVSLA